MFSSHGYPYQLGNNQQPQQQQQLSYPHHPYTPQPPPHHYPQSPPSYQPGYPHPQPYQQPLPQQPPPPHQQPPPQTQPPQYTPERVSMPLLQQPEPVPQTANQEMVDPSFVELLSLSTEELTAFLEDDEKVTEMVQNLEEVKQKKLDKEMSLAENRSLADFNLSREPRLTENRAQYITRLQEAQRIRDSYMVGKAKLDSLKEQNSLDTALALMQAATANAEEDSEEVADDFLKGDITVEDFLDTFMPKRQTAHLRHIKSEKMQEMLTQRQQARAAPQGGTTQNSAMPPYSTSQHQQFAQSSPPYTYQPQRPAPRPPGPRPPYSGPQYGPGAPMRMPTLGPYPQ